MLSGRPKNLTLAPRTRSLLQIFQIDLGVVPRDESLQLRGREHPDPLRLDDGTEATNEGSCLVLDLRVHSKVGHQMDVANSVTTRGKQRELTGQGGRVPTGWKMNPVGSEVSYTNTRSARTFHQNYGDEDDSSPGRPTASHWDSLSVKGIPSCTPPQSQWVRQGGTTPLSRITVRHAPAKERALLSTKGLLFHFILLDMHHLRYHSVLQRKTVSG